jgi:hypothetical protein
MKCVGKNSQKMHISQKNDYQFAFYEKMITNAGQGNRLTMHWSLLRRKIPVALYAGSTRGQQRKASKMPI